MDIQENAPVGRKTTMRVGGEARYYAEPSSQADVQQAVHFAKEHNLPLIPLGAGANTIFADGVINALVIRPKYDSLTIDGTTVTVGAGKNLAMLINELAQKNLDLSALTGIPGTIGGAVFGNAGQGPGGIWIDTFVQSVEAFVNGEWKTFSREECNFRYRESGFKDMTSTPIIWSTVLKVPSKPQAQITAEIERLLKRRLETQPHIKTAGSCFKALPDGTPAWKLIDAAGLRGYQVGGIEVSQKHANFLLNQGEGTFADVQAVIQRITQDVPQIDSIEMRLYGEDGTLLN